MARFSRLRPVNSIKKVVDASGALVASTVSSVVIADVGTTAWVDAADNNVPQGCTISSIFLSIFMQLDASVGAAVPLLEWFFAKNPGTNITLPEPGSTGGDQNRRWILHEEKGLGNDVSNGGTPMVFKGVLKIPPRMRRMGADDSLQLRLLSENHAALFCVKAIYKFYR